jgi:5'-nucleotidase
MNPLRILITNDDGITAPGIAVLECVARKRSGDVRIVAPDFERSGASRSISLAEPVRVRQIDERRYSLMRGTPTDCVAVAVNSIRQDKATITNCVRRAASSEETTCNSA